MAVAFARFARAVLFGALFGVTDPSLGQEHPQNEPGKFDFYMFALSWSPSFCADSAERGCGRSEPPPRSAMRITAAFLRRSRPVAAI
jgi:ribonuclease I